MRKKDVAAESTHRTHRRRTEIDLVALLAQNPTPPTAPRWSSPGAPTDPSWIDGLSPEVTGPPPQRPACLLPPAPRGGVVFDAWVPPYSYPEGSLMLRACTRVDHNGCAVAVHCRSRFRTAVVQGRNGGS
eukprot:TRINITY_DN15799_c0_g1_i1.p3 TRINITY_DN15799_c0_g1~~TRINITY_DN15799_c0_g1_i1.p3  ORF type:complete len:130 (+),score=7.94 TRINITY_DN15799_c0_g1_i1:122-511(+)